MIKAAAQFTRDFMQDFHGETPLVKSQQLSAIARAVWAQNIRLAQSLLRHSELAREYLEIWDNVVRLRDQHHFGNISDNINTALSNDRLNAVVCDRRVPDKEAKTKRISEMARLWIPFMRRFVVSGLKVDANVIRSEPQLTIACGAAWQPTFNAKPFESEAALSFLRSLGDIGSYTPPHPPTTLHMIGLLVPRRTRCLVGTAFHMLLGRWLVLLQLNL
jgi:hypothetical protein